MRVECRQAVAQAIGRDISDAEARGIDERITSTMRRLASRDPNAWRSMPKADRLRAAADVAAKDIEHAAQLKEQRAALAVQAHARHVPDVEAAGAEGFKVIQRKLDQADAYVKGVHHEYLRQTLDAIDYATKQDSGSLVMRGVRWISNLENPQKSLAFVREVFGQDSGDAGAKAAAKAWVQSIEGMRQRFNAAGGDVRKLSYGYLPQPHDSVRVREAGLQRWVSDVLPLVDRERYYTEAGRMLNDAELGQALEQAWRTIQSDGWANVEPGMFRGEPALANAGNQSRVIHFKDAEAYVTYLRDYGAGTVFDAINGHLQWMSKNIGLVEEFGPNPNALFRTMHDIATQAGGTDRVGLLWNTEDMWKTLTGAFNNPQSQTAARIGQGLRNIEVFGKLQSALLSSVTDLGTYFVTLGYNRLGFWQGTANLVRSFGPEARRFADLAGLIAESKVSDMNRWAEDNIGAGITSRLANATMKASLLNAWTDALRRGFSVTMMAGMGKLSRTAWSALEAGDRARLQAKGWSEPEWSVLQHAQLERWRSTDMLTPAAVHAIEGVDEALKQRAISRLLGTIVDESEYASLAPDLTTRTAQTGGLQKGTGKGELWRCIMLFKSFPIAMLSRHWQRVLHSDMGPAGKLTYGASLMFGTTLLGAVALQLGALRDGKNPYDVTGKHGEDAGAAAKFWLSAFTKGGGAGFFGDMLLNDGGRGGQSASSTLLSAAAGPVLGSAAELGYDVIRTNIKEAYQGKETHAGAEAFRWLRGHLPFVNMWYGKLAIDQAVLNQLQEFLSPGYLAKVRARAEKDWGASWWWAPQDTGLLDGGMQGPERAPDLAAAVGER